MKIIGSKTHHCSVENLKTTQTWKGDILVLETSNFLQSTVVEGRHTLHRRQNPGSTFSNYVCTQKKGPKYIFSPHLGMILKLVFQGNNASVYV